MTMLKNYVILCGIILSTCLVVHCYAADGDVVRLGKTNDGRLVMGDSATTPPLNITERSTEPSAPATGDMYLDDGTNTASTLPGWRRYTGAAWEDVSAASGGASAITDLTATNWRVFYSADGSAPVELALGASGTYLKSNGAAAAPAWATPAGSGDVSKVGTPVNNQLGIWTGDGTLEGDTDLRWDDTTLTVTSNDFQFGNNGSANDTVLTFLSSGNDGTITYDQSEDGFLFGSSDILTTGDIGVTGTRITNGWFTDLTVTNAIAGSITGNAVTVTVTDDESTDDAQEVVFTTDNSNLESDGTFTYNPSTGVVTATGFAGALTGNVTGDVSGQAGTVATITGLAPDTATTAATQTNITTAANLTTVGALDSGSITSGFGSIDNGASAITTTGTVTAGALTVESNTVDFGDVTEDYVLTFNATTNTWAGEAASSGFSDPMTTRGDIIIRDASNTTARLGVGTNGQVLTTDGTDISWGTVSGSFDATAVDAVTWSDGANASNVWTFDVSGTDTTMTFGDASIAIVGALTVNGSTNDGSTNILVGRDSDEATVFSLDTNGNITTYGAHTVNVTIVNSATYDLLTTDYILNVTYTATGAVTSLTLPTAQCVTGRIITIKDAGGNAGTNSITIDTEGAETIDGSATFVVSSNYASYGIYSDGSNWFIR